MTQNMLGLFKAWKERMDYQDMMELLKALKERTDRYQKKYQNASDLPEQFCKLQRREIEESFASFIEGAELAVLFLAGTEERAKIADFFQDMDLEFYKAQTITGVVID